MDEGSKDDRLKLINEKLKLLMDKKGITMQATLAEKADQKK